MKSIAQLTNKIKTFEVFEMPLKEKGYVSMDTTQPEKQLLFIQKGLTENEKEMVIDVLLCKGRYLTGEICKN